MTKLETRFCTELRAEGQGDEMALVGYASVFSSLSNDLGGFREMVAPGAFTRSLQAGADVKCTFNHDPSKILGRTASKTLTLATDEKGLKFRCQLDPMQQSHKDLYQSVKRGDVSECSFAFTVDAAGQDWMDVRDNGDFYAMRTLKDVDLIDVSAVTYPAYPGTDVSARMFSTEAMVEIRSAIDTLKAKRATQGEKRDLSIEDTLCQISKALGEKYPATGEYAQCCPGCGAYWIVETYTGHVIACEQSTGKYFSIPYSKDATTDGYLFGDPTEVEQTWVPSERGNKTLAETRSKFEALIAQHKAVAAEHNAQADAAAAKAKEHEDAAALLQAAADRKLRCDQSDGNCEDPTCECQNRDCGPDDIWCEGDDEDAENDDRARVRSERRAGLATKIEFRADGKARTKTVGGKALTKDKFAFVGDPEKTETWKLPIHDAEHVRNALARFNQTEGIPADSKSGVYRKIVAAAKKFGIEVSKEQKSLALKDLPMDAEEKDDIQRRLRAAMLT